MQRTQIYLSSSLRQEIDKQRRQTGESLAEYLRKAAEKRVKADKKQKVDLKKLADAFIGSSTKTDAEIKEWLDWIQKEKKLVDERIDEKWKKARNK